MSQANSQPYSALTVIHANSIDNLSVTLKYSHLSPPGSDFDIRRHRCDSNGLDSALVATTLLSLRAPAPHREYSPT